MAATAQKPYTWGTGRRKTAVARVRIREGTGQFIVNGLDSKEYFPLIVEQKDTREPLAITEMAGRIDVFVNVRRQWQDQPGWRCHARSGSRPQRISP